MSRETLADTQAGRTAGARCVAATTTVQVGMNSNQKMSTNPTLRRAVDTTRARSARPAMKGNALSQAATTALAMFKRAPGRKP